MVISIQLQRGCQYISIEITIEITMFINDLFWILLFLICDALMGCNGIYMENMGSFMGIMEIDGNRHMRLPGVSRLVPFVCGFCMILPTKTVSSWALNWILHTGDSNLFLSFFGSEVMEDPQVIMEDL